MLTGSKRSGRVACGARCCCCSRGRGGRADHHHAEAALRLQHRRRLPARQLHAVRRLLAEARQGIRPDEARRDRQDRRRAAAADGDHHLAREPQEARALQGDRAQAGARRRAHRRAGARAGEGRQGGRLDRRRTARHRGARRAAADRDGLSAGQPHRRRDDAVSQRRVILAVHANPDGMELVSNWYMREKRADAAARANGLPRLYQKYIGHDNNRDFYMSTQPESTNMNRVMYIEWFPQIMYNHHQTGPAGTVMFAPPFRDPFNYNFDPLIPAELDLVGRRCTAALPPKASPGVTSRKGASYSTWWNGGLRTMAYFHNMIGLLTETIGNPTPTSIPFVPSKQLPGLEPALPDRAAGLALPPVDRLLGDGQLRGARHRVAQQGELPLQHLSDGQELDRARQPRQLDADAAPRSSRRRTRSSGGRGAAAVARAGGDEGDAGSRRPRRPWRARPRSSRSCCAIRRRATRAATSCRRTSRTFPTATKFVNALLKTGITVHRATAPFTVGGQELSRRLVRREDGAGVPAARARHVRAAGPPRRHSLSRRPADAAVRQRRLDARVPDGREVRPHPRRLRRSVRDG